MSTDVARAFRKEIASLLAALRGVSPSLANTPWRTGGWTRKQIVGHLLDSATNNRQRFVRASIDGAYAGPEYAQQAWVDAHGYAEQKWETLLQWWQTEHEILVSIVDWIPEVHLLAQCQIGHHPPVTLRFLIEDYVEHQRWHLAQIMGRAQPE